ncbi:MAG TPA: FtsX-like permease family protein [Halothiobacillaceae bacterium]|nr:FtsX-like permease family protein [Halothiobacillaceae bacterium]
MTQTSQPNIWSIAWQGLQRELVSGLLTPMLIALLIAVASVTSVGFFVDRVESGIKAQAAQFLAADGRIESRDPIETPAEQAEELGLKTARLVEFPTVVLAGEQSMLSSLKAVDAAYPLRGELEISQGTQTREVVRHGPKPGTVWVAPRLMAALDLSLGDQLEVGRASLEVAAVLEREPDVGNVFSQAAPRVMMHHDDLAATELVSPASIVTYALLVASRGDSADGALLDRLRAQLDEGYSLQSPEGSQPMFATAFERAAQFLGLASMVAVLLAGAALVIAAKHYNQVQQNAAALMRAMGASSKTIGRIYRLRLLMLALLAAIPGVLIGALVQLALADLMGQVLDIELPPPGIGPVFLGVGIAIIALFGFAMPALVKLRHTPPNRVLNKSQQAASPAAVGLFAAGFLAIAVLVYLQAQDLILTGYVLGGLGLALVVFVGVAWGLITLLRRVPVSGMARFGLARMAQDRMVSAIQIAALALGVTAILVLSIVQRDLIENWQTQVPADAPNHFAINIQQDERADFEEYLEQRSIEHAGFYPMIRGRWVAHHGKPVDFDQYQGQAHRLATREFNLSRSDKLIEGNRVIAGTFPDDGYSVDKGIAETLGWSLGDELTFRISGREYTAEITSIREVDWDSMQPNFFVTAPESILGATPSQFITSFYLPPDQAIETQVALQRAFATVTVFDVTRILDEVREVIARASQAVGYVFFFTLAAGLVVLFSAFTASERVRVNEAAILRVLGARRKTVLAALGFEFLVLGLLVGLMAAVAAGMLGWVLGAQVFDIPSGFNLALLFWGALVGLGLAALLTPTLGWKMTRISPNQALNG